MKSSNSSFAIIASILLCHCAFASTGFAATNPLNIPRGLAVDSKGNLWVANAGSNSILAFSPTYEQLTADTITANVFEPTGVAFDSLGNLWVSNQTNAFGAPDGSITEYTKGVQNTSATITNDIQYATGLAVDGFDNIWVSNETTSNQYTLNVYIPTQVYGPANTVQDSFGPYTPPFIGIAVANGNLVWGNGASLNFAPASQILTTNTIPGVSIGGSNTATYVASDSNGTIYFATTENTINYAVPSKFGQASELIELSFPPTGIAVDSARGRIYISSGFDDSIVAYSTTGKLLHTIN